MILLQAFYEITNYHNTEERSPPIHISFLQQESVDKTSTRGLRNQMILEQDCSGKNLNDVEEKLLRFAVNGNERNMLPF